MPILDPDQDHRITLAEAIEMTAKYREGDSFTGDFGGFFSRSALLAILEQSDCAGIRYYYGLNSDGKPVLVLVGATAENVDLYNGELCEMATPCPSFCDLDSPLRNNE
jgi:hypothetical protein